MEKKYLSRDKIVGKEVIDSNAIKVGNVKDMALDLGSKNIALTIITKMGSDITVSGENILVVGEVALLNKPVELPTPAPAETLPVIERPPAPPQPVASAGLCSFCGYQNDLSAKFCIKCGHKL